MRQEVLVQPSNSFVPIKKAIQIAEAESTACIEILAA